MYTMRADCLRRALCYCRGALPAALLLFSASGVSGCKPDDSAKAGNASPPTTSGKPNDSTPSTADANASSGGKDAKSTEKPTPKLPLAQVPDGLKSDAYYYYGLSSDKPLKLEMTASNQPGKHFSGSQTMFLEKVVGGVPYFKIERTGEFQQFGEQELRLEKDAIYNVSSTIAKIGPHDIEMPAQLTPGTTWKTHTDIEQASTPEIDDSVWKVVGMRKVKTPAGEHDALYITSSGHASVGGKAVKTTTQNWFVKDMGPVKQVLEMTEANGKKTDITIQEIK